ncbi:MAG TPA: hypothetical protein VGF48_15780 [Thermoanaerobaculia bacterium]|jgi:hypothetical protein
MRKPLALLLLLALPAFAGPSTNNDDTCDIATLPAATLLLPYFEVDLHAADKDAQTTLFTVTNVTSRPQIANVTLWTDWAYPVLSFDVFLTGYDAQSINLRDVLVRGTIHAGSAKSARGGYSQQNDDNPNFLNTALEACSAPPPPLSPELLAELRQVLTLGTKTGCGANARVGGQHLMATGFITIDLVATCSSLLPNDARYFDQLLYDNVLTGDYQFVLPNPLIGNFAGGESLVHIRAVPEGGRAGAMVATSLPYTFYDRFLPRAKAFSDRRQPLPSAWAARYIQGSTGGFQTDLLLWREATAAASATCDTVQKGIETQLAEVVRFDERENPMTSVPFATGGNYLPAAARLSTLSDYLPALTTGDVHGWIYLNADNGGSESYHSSRDMSSGSSTKHGPRPGQSWILPMMTAEGRYSMAMPATMLANGCTPSAAKDATIKPASNATP